MNTATLDRDLYQAWWEAEGRGDLATCPCGQPSADAFDYGTFGRFQSGGVSRPGFCPRHAHMLASREEFAAAVIDGTFVERDLTEAQIRKARKTSLGLRVIDGTPRSDA